MFSNSISNFAIYYAAEGKKKKNVSDLYSRDKNHRTSYIKRMQGCCRVLSGKRLRCCTCSARVKQQATEVLSLCVFHVPSVLSSPRPTRSSTCSPSKICVCSSPISVSISFVHQGSIRANRTRPYSSAARPKTKQDGDEVSKVESVSSDAGYSFHHFHQTEVGRMAVDTWSPPYEEEVWISNEERPVTRFKPCDTTDLLESVTYPSISPSSSVVALGWPILAPRCPGHILLIRDRTPRTIR